nr:immunoglobulin heavy chain junction region [Macaca mulatta]
CARVGDSDTTVTNFDYW